VRPAHILTRCSPSARFVMRAHQDQRHGAACQSVCPARAAAAAATLRSLCICSCTPRDPTFPSMGTCLHVPCGKHGRTTCACRPSALSTYWSMHTNNIPRSLSRHIPISLCRHRAASLSAKLAPTQGILSTHTESRTAHNANTVEMLSAMPMAGTLILMKLELSLLRHTLMPLLRLHAVACRVWCVGLCVRRP